MGADGQAFLDKWHRIVRERDKAGAREILAEGIEMGAPPHWRKLEGREWVGKLLGVIMDTIEDFTYHREWVNGNELALEFTGRVGRHGLQGVDLISLDDEGRIKRLDVMIRPLNTLSELANAVGQRMMG